MPKTSNVYIRIEPDVKEQAEDILFALGLSASSAVNMFLKQVILHRGIPFEVKLPRKRPLDINRLTKGRLDAELAKGCADISDGRAKPAGQVFESIREDYGI